MLYIYINIFENYKFIIVLNYIKIIKYIIIYTYYYNINLNNVYNI